MTLNEYQLRMEAYQLKKVERQEELAYQSWLNRAVKATKGKGKHETYYYKKFTDLFDTQAQKDRVRKAFEPEYQTTNTKLKHQDRQAILYQRLREWDRMHPKPK